MALAADQTNVDVGYGSCEGQVSGEPITRDVTGEEFYSTLYAVIESPEGVPGGTKSN